MFTRDGAAAYKKDLTNTLALCHALGDPQHQFQSIHIAGTNGKGSTSHALAAIFQASGYKTGLYTSPHLVDFGERIRINGQMIPESCVVAFVQQHHQTIETIKPSFFEVTVAMAFDYFASEQVDIAIIETGLGGRLDSTNVITPILSLITNIGKDHMNMLGNTLEQIAGEKAGIIKNGVPVVISEFQEEVAAVFRQKASESGSPLIFAAQQRKVTIKERQADRQVMKVTEQEGGPSFMIEMDLLGSYQSKNLVGILEAVRQLQQLGWKLPNDTVRSALSRVRELTGLRGRWEILGQSPLLICDTGHNMDGWKEVLANIRLTPHWQLHIVLGVMADKDLDEMLPLLPVDAKYYFCQVDLPRALLAAELKQKALKYGLLGDYFETVAAAVAGAQYRANTDDLIFVGGSTFIVGDLLASRES